MKKKVHIILQNFYSKDGEELTVGGIQTYVKMLLPLIEEVGMIPVIYQASNIDFNKKFNNINVFGVKTNNKDNMKKIGKKIVKFIKKNYNTEDIILFANDNMIVKNKFKNVIAIQHGIYWDVRNHEEFNHFFNMMYVIFRAISSILRVNSFKYVNELVCVDYNFVNWYRTQVAYTEANLKVITNCTYIPESVQKDDTKINIIFARRFNDFRGTTLFSDAIEEVIKKNDNIHITFAGDGPEREKLMKRFDGISQVEFIKYLPEQSLSVHSKYDIAVIPTIGSEGTSLSLLEAMACKCAVIATNVGGMTNIILDGYNGLMISPNKDELIKSINMLIEDTNFRKEISSKAQETVIKSFNREEWNIKWKEVFNSYK